jgi:transcriptional regulator GlxA family with amidase domain
MSGKKNEISVALVAVPEATASTLYGLYDLFSSVGRDWEMLVGESTGEARMRPYIVAARPGELRGANGCLIEARRTFADSDVPDIICIPDLLIAPGAFTPGGFAEAVAWIVRCHAAGSLVACACSGALLLAETGLLDNAEATSHWGYGETFRRCFPRVRLDLARTLIGAGVGERLVTAGGGSSWHDLALYLIARFVGDDAALRIAKLYLLDWHASGQLPYASLLRTTQHEDALVAQAQAWISEHFRDPAPVSAMLRRSGLAERTFKRRFARATGMSPLEYVHTLRLEAAKQRLEQGEAVIEAIAEEVGYEDGSFFRRLFRRQVGITPHEYRRRFGALRCSLAR